MWFYYTKMAQLVNPKHEAFAQAVAAGEKGIAAYRTIYRSGQHTAKKQAYNLRKRADIQARIAELQPPMPRTGHLTLDDKRAYAADLVFGRIIEPASVSMAKINVMKFDSDISGDRAASDGTQPTPGSLEEAFRNLLNRESNPST